MPNKYFDYIKGVITKYTYKNYNLTSDKINNIVKNSNPAQLTSEQDPLYVRIESEELNEGNNEKQNTLVRQTFLNVKSGYNAAEGRPMVIFYEGPDRGLTEAYDTAEVSGQTTNPKERYPNLSFRTPQPVILNLESDFRGIIFAPHSPVVILGNGHKLESFVVADKFVKLLEQPSGVYKYKKTYTPSGYTQPITLYTDEFGNIGTEDLQPGDPTYTRRPKDNEIPYNSYEGRQPSDYKNFDEYINDTYKDYTNIDINKLKEYEWVYKTDAFGLSPDSHYDHFGIVELQRDVYSSLNPDNSKDMFFTTVRSKWVT